MDAAKVRSDEIQKNSAMQQHQAANSQNRAEDRLKQVYSRSKTEEVRITDKQREERQKGGERHKEKEKDEEKEYRKGNIPPKYGSAGSTARASKIDIKI